MSVQSEKFDLRVYVYTEANAPVCVKDGVFIDYRGSKHRIKEGEPYVYGTQVEPRYVLLRHLRCKADIVAFTEDAPELHLTYGVLPRKPIIAKHMLYRGIYTYKVENDPQFDRKTHVFTIDTLYRRLKHICVRGREADMDWCSCVLSTMGIFWV
jgi:hypothetical protein